MDTLTTDERNGLEKYLIFLARQYAPRLAPPDWQKPGDLRLSLTRMARALADENVITLIGYRRDHDSKDVPGVVNDCKDAYLRLYTLLVDTLYEGEPALRTFRGWYFPLPLGRDKLCVFMHGETRPVMRALAGLVVPYVAVRQGVPVLDIELDMLLDRLLRRLDDENELTRDQVAKLRQQGRAMLRDLLGMSLRQVELIPFDEPFFPPVDPPPDLPGSARVDPFYDSQALKNHDEPLDFIQHMYEPDAHAEPPPPPKQPETPDAAASLSSNDDEPGGATGPGPAVDPSSPDGKPPPPPAPQGRGRPPGGRRRRRPPLPGDY